MNHQSEEQWRPVSGMPGLEVSTAGRFRRDGRVGIGWRDPRGYRWVQYNKDGGLVRICITCRRDRVNRCAARRRARRDAMT